MHRFSRLAGAVRHRWVRRTALLLLALFILFGLFGYFAAPGIIKSQAEKSVSAALHRKFTIERVEVSPYALAVSVHGVKLYEPDGQAVFASLQDLRARISASSLIHRAPVVRELHVVGPFVHLARTGPNRYSTDDIVAALAAGAPAGAGTAPPPAGPGARFSVYNIRVDGGRFEFDDQPAHIRHTVADLQLGIPFISSLPSQEELFVQPLLSAVINGAPLSIKGRARPFAPTREAVVDLDFERVDLPGYLGYLPFEPRFRMPGGRLDLHLQASFQQPVNGPAAVILSGKATLHSLQLATPDGNPMLTLPQLVVELGKVDLLGRSVEIARVAASGLDVSVVKDGNGRLNLQALFPPDASPAAGSGPERASVPAGAGVRLAIGQIALTDAALRFSDRDPAHPLDAAVEQLDLGIGDTAFDLQQRRLGIARIDSISARFRLRQGRAESVHPAAADQAPAPASPAPARAAAREAAGAGPAGAPAPWNLSVGRLSIGNWALRIESRGLPQLAVTAVTAIRLSAENLSTAAGATPGRIDLKAQVNRRGSMAVAGELGLTPAHANLALDLKSVDLLALQPYVTERVNLLITQAELASRGRLVLDQGADGSFKGGFRGDAALGNVATIDKVNGNEFVNWKSLSFGGVNAELAPFALDIDQIALADFFARVIIDPSGRINLQDVMRSSPGEQRSLTSEEARNTETPAPSAKAPAALVAEAAADAAAKAAAPAAAPPIHIRQVTVQSGRVRFTDDFIKPNYTAELVELGGTVAGLSSAADSAAAVDLHGEVNNAPLSIAGSINPIKGDLLLDLKASVHGMELAPLSAYSGKYAGYGIEQGKLSFDVAYRLEHRQLSAENRLVLDQLTFGDRVDSPTATTLPVRLAVALLKDRNGVIDIDLPIGGSLDDPQFSVGGVIVRVFVNLITKAVTAPFALLGSLFGGGAELSFIDYEPGRSGLTAEAESRLKSLAKALGERPGLKLEIAARVDPVGDRDGLRRGSLDRRLRAIKVKDLVAKGQSVTMADVSIAPQEYPDLLARAYGSEKDAGDKTARPRGAAAAPGPVSPAEMEKALLADAAVGDDDLIALGNRRSESVKKWLQTAGQVPPDRLFLLATKLRTGGASGQAPQESAAAGRVEFSLK
jgi:hypothetical protein